MKRFTVVTVVLLLTFSAFALAQDVKHEITVQGTGFISKETTNNGLINDPTNSAGFVIGYRYNLNRWFGFEGDFDYFRTSQKCQGIGTPASVKTNGYAGTGSLVVKIPVSSYVRPYALVGGGGIVFDPRDNSSFSSQARGTLVYGGGADIPLTKAGSDNWLKHVSLRTEYRGFVYKVPDFGRSALNVNKFTHTAVPSVGLVWSF